MEVTVADPGGDPIFGYCPRAGFLTLTVVNQDPGRGRSGAGSSRLILPFEDLPVAEQALLEVFVGDALQGGFAVDGQRGSSRGGLAEDHEHRLHSDRAVSDMRRR